MADDYQTELDDYRTEEQVKRLRKHWTTYDSWWCIFTALTVAVFIGCAKFAHPLVTLFFVLPLTGWITYSLWRWSLQRFIRRLSKEDRELILRLPDTQSKTIQNFDLLLKGCQVDAQKELLRASQSPQDNGTLLRAATLSSDTTPQEQLLRPSQIIEE